MVFRDTPGPDGRGSRSVCSASMSAVLEVNTTNEGLLQFSTLIAAWDKQTNKLTGPFSWACASPDLNLICLLLVLLNTGADVEPSSQPLHSEGGGGAHKLSIVQTMSMWAYGFRHI